MNFSKENQEVMVGRLGAYSVFDSKAKYFMTPFFTHNNGTAIRSFIQLASDPQSMVALHPEDFNLFRIGSFDDSTGSLLPQNPVSLGLAASFVSKPKEV